LLAQPLPSTMANFDLMEKSKMNVLVAYAIEDLIWVYLKSRGIDSTSHPVSEDLGRIKSYFGKIKQTENPDKRTMAIDKAAAGRFIRAAIASASKGSAQPSSSSDVHQIGTHTRFAHIAKETEKIVPGEEPGSDGDSSSSNEDNDIKVVEAAVQRTREKGKERETGVSQGNESAISKRRRPAMDPFAGYENDTERQAKKKYKKTPAGNATPQQVDVIDVDMEYPSDPKESLKSKSGSPVETDGTKSKKKKRKKVSMKQE